MQYFCFAINFFKCFKCKIGRAFNFKVRSHKVADEESGSHGSFLDDCNKFAPLAHVIRYDDQHTGQAGHGDVLRQRHEEEEDDETLPGAEEVVEESAEAVEEVVEESVVEEQQEG